MDKSILREGRFWPGRYYFSVDQDLSYEVGARRADSPYSLYLERASNHVAIVEVRGGPAEDIYLVPQGPRDRTSLRGTSPFHSAVYHQDRRFSPGTKGWFQEIVPTVDYEPVIERAFGPWSLDL